MKTKQNNQKGFTIIEVLIVMAIAGLILLIVFLAVPALQRNSRNTQRKNDVAALLGSMSEFATNNNGTLPTVVAPIAGGVRFSCPTCTTTSEIKLGYFTGGVGNAAGQVNISAFVATGAFNTAANDRVLLMRGASCTAANGSQTGSARQIIAMSVTEAGPNDYDGACQES